MRPFLFSLVLLALGSSCSSTEKHWQVHLSLGADETEMIVTWQRKHHHDNLSYVKYGRQVENMNHKVTAERTKFVQGGTKFFTFRALMVGLKPKTTYYYRVGNHKAWSPVFTFKTLPHGSDWLPSLAVYGDMGIKNDVSLPDLIEDVKKDMYNVIFHIGDLAYNLDSHNGKIGDEFMKAIEPLAAKVPYMTCPGNHEPKANFSHYDARFSMLGDRQHPQPNRPLSSRLNNHFYSLDIGPAHIILFSTEFYYFTKWGWDQIRWQYEWLKEDLRKANENRYLRPWIIVMGHRPLYCIKAEDTSCSVKTLERPDIRRGIRWGVGHHREHLARKSHHHRGKKAGHGRGKRSHHAHRHHGHKLKGTGKIVYGLEKLFYKFGVDLEIYGHEHYYARMSPVYKYRVAKKDFGRQHHYVNPEAPIHIVTGSGGCWENHSSFLIKGHEPEWLAVHEVDYGYSRLRFDSRTKLVFEQYSVDKKSLIDKFVIEKKTRLGSSAIVREDVEEEEEEMDNFNEVDANLDDNVSAEGDSEWLSQQFEEDEELDGEEEELVENEVGELDDSAEK